ncbi:MAG TPA: LapA family protein [Tabrizicola sp.]|nr:LapA family protein [Tabrizicola sp.]
MIRIIRLLILGLIGLSLLTLALANRAGVNVHLLPVDLAALTGLSWSVEVPLFVAIFGGVILGSIVLGVLIGFVWEWLRESKHRTSASAGSREVARLERELASLREAKAGPKDEILALLEKP